MFTSLEQLEIGQEMDEHTAGWGGKQRLKKNRSFRIAQFS